MQAGLENPDAEAEPACQGLSEKHVFGKHPHSHRDCPGVRVHCTFHKEAPFTCAVHAIQEDSHPGWQPPAHLPTSVPSPILQSGLMVSLNAFAVAQSMDTGVRRTCGRGLTPSFMTQEKHCSWDSFGSYSLVCQRGLLGKSECVRDHSTPGTWGRIHVSCHKTCMNTGVRLQCPCVPGLFRNTVRVVSLVIRKPACCQEMSTLKS